MSSHSSSPLIPFLLAAIVLLLTINTAAVLVTSHRTPPPPPAAVAEKTTATPPTTAQGVVLAQSDNDLFVLRGSATCPQKFQISSPKPTDPKIITDAADPTRVALIYDLTYPFGPEQTDLGAVVSVPTAQYLAKKNDYKAYSLLYTNPQVTVLGTLMQLGIDQNEPLHTGISDTCTVWLSQN